MDLFRFGTPLNSQSLVPSADAYKAQCNTRVLPIRQIMRVEKGIKSITFVCQIRSLAGGGGTFSFQRFRLVQRPRDWTLRPLFSEARPASSPTPTPAVPVPAPTASGDRRRPRKLLRRVREGRER